jgi:hypothetical protein
MRQPPIAQTAFHAHQQTQTKPRVYDNQETKSILFLICTSDYYRIDYYRIDYYRIDYYRIDYYRIDYYRIDYYRINSNRIIPTKYNVPLAETSNLIFKD